MAKRRNPYAFPGQRPAQIDSMDQSRFWRRLDELAGAEQSEDRKRAIDHLKASIRKVTERAKWISTQVCRFMPQYTLHEERHFLNVLAIMDALVPDEVIVRFGALDCGLPILAACTHDLGMALSQEEYDRLRDESTEQGKHFASYRTRYDEELRQLKRWRKRREELSGNTDAESQQEAAAACKRIESIEGHILASYLRDTHTEDEQVRRLRRWLDVIKQETGDENVFRYGVGGKDYQRELAMIGISHGRGAPWLRWQLIEGGPDDRFFQPVATGESANLAFPGLLLRLADVMDFDASRAPRILFKHFGIENDRSVLEWNKHLSVVGWRLDIDPDGKQQPDLLYSVECEHPVHEKAIREFKTWIDAELSAVRIELDAQRRQLPVAAQDHYDLHLPSQTRLDIRPVRHPLTDQPKYVYHDLQFRLDQDEIQQLLMGESLYGDPGLCIRELLQNALDALELRELRLKMKQKGEAREPVDGELIRPGWVREPDGREEELRVTLDWGTDEETGQQWLRVTDNGVGMTEEVIKNYFTQIGKSYYRSPEFSQERAAMKAAGEVVSPISIFGIGILSCFMIADRMRIATCAGKDTDGGQATWDVTVSGPGSLFWLRRGTRRSQGTEIKVYLKREFRIKHDAKRLVKSARWHFGYRKGAEDATDSRSIDPIVAAVTNVVWPRYPVKIRHVMKQDLSIDASLHSETLAPIDRKLLLQKAADWNCPGRLVLEPQWKYWEWQDSIGPDATGSRIRFWFPTIRDTHQSEVIPLDPQNQMHSCRQDELAAFVEGQLEYRNRTRIMVRGMHVSDMSVCNDFTDLHRIGARIWFDLCGNAAPTLTASRQKAYAADDKSSWRKTLKSVLERASIALSNELRGQPSAQTNVSLACKLGGKFVEQSQESTGSRSFSLSAACSTSWTAAPHVSGVEFTAHRFLQYYAGGAKGDEHRRLKLANYRVFRTLARKAAGRTEPRLAQDIARAALERSRRARALEYDRQFEERFRHKFAMMSTHLQAAILNDGFAPDISTDLCTSWPKYQLFDLSGAIGDAMLAAPDLAEFELASDSHTVAFADPQGKTPAELVQRGYDLTFPMTAVPLGQLRRECAEWRTDRWYRPLGVAPFLLPALHDIWPQHAAFLQQTFGVPHIYCLLPRFELWSKRFSDWTDDDWHDPENLSALWDLSGHLTGTPGQVLWTRGTHHINEVPKVGLPAPEFLDANRT